MRDRWLPKRSWRRPRRGQSLSVARNCSHHNHNGHGRCCPSSMGQTAPSSGRMTLSAHRRSHCPRQARVSSRSRGLRQGGVALTPSDAATGGIEWDGRCNYGARGARVDSCRRQERHAAVGVRLVTHLRRPVERTRRKETPCTTTAEALARWPCQGVSCAGLLFARRCKYGR